jgi:hypothetical protein
MLRRGWSAVPEKFREDGVRSTRNIEMRVTHDTKKVESGVCSIRKVDRGVRCTRGVEIGEGRQYQKDLRGEVHRTRKFENRRVSGTKRLRWNGSKVPESCSGESKVPENLREDGVRSNSKVETTIVKDFGSARCIILDFSLKVFIKHFGNACSLHSEIILLESGPEYLLS